MRSGGTERALLGAEPLDAGADRVGIASARRDAEVALEIAERLGPGFAEPELRIDVLEGHRFHSESLFSPQLDERPGRPEEGVRPDDEVSVECRAFFSHLGSPAARASNPGLAHQQ
jgi:hypothetical protein